MTQVRVTGLRAVLRSLGAATGSSEVLRILRNVGQATRTVSRQSIEGSRSPEGETFAPLKRARSHGRRGTTDHPLLNTGDLMRSITYTVDASGRSVLRIVSTRRDAAYHQTGTRHMPARPFVPASDEWYRERVARLLARWGVA